MGKDSAIAWTHHTFSPWEGCAKVSEGCRHCYAETRNARFHPRAVSEQGANGIVRGEHWGPYAPRLMRSETYWRQPLAWARAAEKAGERHRVFCASLADVFEERTDLNDSPADLRNARARLFRLIEDTPQLDWLLLTKRPQNMVPMTIARWWPKWPDNVWAGTSVESQEQTGRIAALFEVPARVRFLSCEPLLGPLNLRSINGGRLDAFTGAWMGRQPKPTDRGVALVIVGGESGPGARPYHIDWARSIIRQCKDAKVACFHKQIGDNARDEFALKPEWCWETTTTTERVEEPYMRLRTPTKQGGEPSEWLEELRVRQMPGDIR